MDPKYQPMTMTFTRSNAVSAANPGATTGAHSLIEALDTLTHQAHSELGNVTEPIFFVGDGLQRATVNGFFDLLHPQTWNPSNVLRLSWSAVQQTIQLSRLLLPNQANLAWQEFRNKLEIFVLVKNLASILGLSGRFMPLPSLVERAYTVSPFAVLWAVEGLGHYYADIYWEQRGIPQGLLSEDQAPVPMKSLLMLHAGIGLSFADRLLGGLASDASSELVRSTVEYFLTLCRNNSRKGYLGAAVESLGLVTRDFYPELLARVDQQLQQVGPEFRGYFWHGVGRALYFSREYFIPVLHTVWSGVDREASSAPDRLNALAGLSWAVTLVNMRQPAIMENVVRSYIAHSECAEGFTNGVISSIIMRQDTTPDAPFTAEFWKYQPNTGNQQLAMTWERRITKPAMAALDRYYPVLRRNEALDQVFHYQNLEALVQLMQQQSTRAVWQDNLQRN